MTPKLIVGKMMTYEFTLRFAVPDDVEMASIEKRLFESGCDDALIGIGLKGRLALEFCREAKSAQIAVTSAMADVKRGIPEARLIEAGPDLVGVTDVSDPATKFRQALLKQVTCLSSARVAAY